MGDNKTERLLVMKDLHVRVVTILASVDGEETTSAEDGGAEGVCPDDGGRMKRTPGSVSGESFKA
jgi:hypothetical protein